MVRLLKRSRGRPKSAKTIEAERVKKLFKDTTRNLPCEQSKLTKELIAVRSSWEVVEKQILRDYKYDATVPDDHAFTMASLGDEMLFGYEDQIIAQDEAYRQRVLKQRAKGARTTHENSRVRAQKIILKNKILLSCIRNKGFFSLSWASKKIVTEWEKVNAAQRLNGEHSNLTSRGDGGPVPNERTIRNWIRKYV
jgi:hypothetical protein